MTIRILFLLPLTALISCSNSAKKTEEDRKNIYLAEFYYEQGFPGKSVAHAKKIKKDSPNYEAAQDWIERASYEHDKEEYLE